MTASKLAELSKPSDSEIERVDLGFVGRPEKVDPTVLHALLGVGIYCLAPVGLGLTGRPVT